MDRLKFGRRARRKARLRRAALAAWGVTIVATLIGIPGAATALNWLNGPGMDAKTLGAAAPVRVTDVEGSQSLASELRLRHETFDKRPRKERNAGNPKSAYEGGSVTEIIYAAAAEFGLDGGYLLSVASCESGLNPSAYNSAGYHGLFQFDSTTWGAYGYGDIYDPVAQARTAARLLAAGQASRWPNCA